MLLTPEIPLGLLPLKANFYRRNPATKDWAVYASNIPAFMGNNAPRTHREMETGEIIEDKLILMTRYRQPGGWALVPKVGDRVTILDPFMLKQLLRRNPLSTTMRSNCWKWINLMDDFTTIDVNFPRPEGGTLEMKVSENLSKKVSRLLTGILQRDFLKKIGPYLFASLRKNFDEGGRPDPWPISKRITQQRGRGAVNRQKQAGISFKTLILTGNLKESIHPVLGVTNSLMFKVDAPYGVFHEQPEGWLSQRGVPQRRFLTIPPEDKEAALGMAVDWLEDKIK
jgi:phage gpG-like protein